MVIFIFLVNIFALYNLYSCFAPLSLLWGEILWCVRNKQHHIGVKEKVEGLFFFPCVLGCSASWVHSICHLLSLPFLSVKVKAFGTVNVMGPRRLLLWASFCLEQPLTVDDRDNFKVAITSLITTLTEFTAGQMLVGVFLIHSRENITWFSFVLLTVSGYWEKASFQTLYVHENLTLSIKTLTSDFVLLFLFKILWIWEGSAVTKDRRPSEACSYNLSYSPPLIKVDIFWCAFYEKH